MMIRRLICSCAALLALTGSAAVAQKVGYIASEAIFDNLPDSKAARSRLNEMQSGWMREIERMETEAKRLSAEITSNRLIWSAQEKQVAEANLADLSAKLSAFRTDTYGPNGEFERQQTAVMGPLYDKVMLAVNDEARAQKIDFVFDKSSRGMPMLVANPQFDLTIAVLKRLGVDVDSATFNPAGTPNLGTQSEEDAVRNRGRRNEGGEKPLLGIDPNKLLEKGLDGVEVNLPSFGSEEEGATPEGTTTEGTTTEGTTTTTPPEGTSEVTNEGTEPK